MGLAKTRLGQHGYAWYVISTGDAANVKATCHEVQVAAFSKLSASVVEEPLNLGKSGPGTFRKYAEFQLTSRTPDIPDRRKISGLT